MTLPVSDSPPRKSQTALVDAKRKRKRQPETVKTPKDSTLASRLAVKNLQSRCVSPA